MKKKSISIIIPTYNEAKTIKKLIREIKDVLKAYPLEIIVIDAHSSDKTASIAESEKVIVIRRDKKYGKGADFWYASLQSKGEYIIQIDADYQFSPKDIPLLITALDRGADVSLAWRIKHTNAPFIRTFGNKVFCWVTSVAVNKKIHDVVAGFKGYKRNALLSLQLKENHFGYEGEVVVKAVRMGYTIAQVPVSYSPRVTGTSQVSAFRDGPLTIWSILKARFENLSY